MVVRRNLSVTVAMLQIGGLNVRVRSGSNRFQVSLDQHSAVFPSKDQAADWLAACVLLHYPRSDFAKLWRLIAQAAAGDVPV